jgi:hypothetical protein
MAKWSKQDYESVAQIFHEDLRWCLAEDHRAIERNHILRADFADMFAADNSRFDREKFFEACETGKHIRKAIKNG